MESVQLDCHENELTKFVKIDLGTVWMGTLSCGSFPQSPLKTVTVGCWSDVASNNVESIIRFVGSNIPSICN